MPKCEQCSLVVFNLKRTIIIDNMGRKREKDLCRNCRRYWDDHFEKRGSYRDDGTLSGQKFRSRPARGQWEPDEEDE
jgi:hypothetical protein